MPVSSRSPTTATTAPATAPVLELSVDMYSTAARVTVTATGNYKEITKLAEPIVMPLTVEQTLILYLTEIHV